MWEIRTQESCALWHLTGNSRIRRGDKTKNYLHSLVEAQIFWCKQALCKLHFISSAQIEKII